jgi:hypothetical protein
MLRATVMGTVLLAAGLLAACDDAQPAPPGSQEAKIIGAGHAAVVEVSETGQVLISYEQSPEDDEGTYLSAWRLYDDSDQPVADGRGSREEGGSAQPRLWSLPEGFLMRRPYYSTELERIDPEGDVSPVRFVDRALPTRAGDVLVTEQSQTRARFYRPSDDTTYRLPELPRGLESVAIDQRGGVWLVLSGEAGTTAYSPDGRAPWRTLDYDLPSGSIPGQFTASGEAMLLPLLDYRSSRSGVTGLLTQDIATPGRWVRVELTGVDSRQWIEPEVAVVAPGRLLLGDWGPRWYVGGAGTWTRIALPDQDPHEDFFLEAKGGRIFAHGSQDSEFRWSDDLGRSWHNFDR